MIKTKTTSTARDKVLAHLTFSLKIDFCPIYSRVNLSVNPTGCQREGWGCCYLLKQALILCSTSFVKRGQREKKALFSHPYLHPGSRSS